MSTNKNKLPFEVKDFGLRSHMNMSNCGIRVDAGTIDWPGNPIHGKDLCREVYTPKTKMGGWGKGKASFYIGEKGSPTFDTIEAFVAHYELAAPKEEYSGQTSPPEPLVKLKPEALAKRKEGLRNKKDKS